jgi:chemotaxis family two-component system sensor kinase Cph1
VTTVRSPLALAVDSAALLACDREPIRTPGGIQPRGALIVVDEDDLRVRYASDNLEGYLGGPARRLLGRCLPELSPDPIGALVHARLADRATGRPVRLTLATGRVVDLFAHRSGGRVVIELENVVDDGQTASFDAFQGDVLDTLERLQRAGDVQAVLEAAVSTVHELTGFDRVLAYRFEADGHGVVESERMTVGLSPFLGLHYPASDIPSQARALYREQWIRVIPDANLAAVDLLGLAGEPPATSIDLSAAVMRAVSPVHLQYLRNMQVHASLSISLVVEGELWGLIVCHDYRSPRVVPYGVRAACEIVGMTASMAIGTKDELAVVERRLGFERTSSLLLERVAGASTIAEGLLDDPELLLGVCGAAGVAVRIGGALRRAGSTPSEIDVDRILGAIRSQLDQGAIFATDQLGTSFPALADLSHDASGVLALNLSYDGGNAIVWFRPELVATVTWAGEPHKVVAVAPDGARWIGPRESFAEWVEIVRGQAQHWGSAEIDAVASMRSSLGSFLLERAEQLALALETTRLFDREHFIAQTLKESLLPAPLPETPELDVRATYIPAGEGYGVSGDFFEVFPADDAWFAVIGDVCGKGPRAAGLTALARHTIRAVVLQDPDATPSRVVSVLNEAFMDQAGGLFATVQVVRVSPKANGVARVALCSGGHPPALHRCGGAVHSRSSRNTVVGARRGLPFDDVEIDLEPGDALVMYTDGVTEAGRPNELYGDQRLVETVANAGVDSAAIVGAVEDAVRAHQQGELRDDIAILCLRNLP